MSPLQQARLAHRDSHRQNSMTTPKLESPFAAIEEAQATHRPATMPAKNAHTPGEWNIGMPYKGHPDELMRCTISTESHRQIGVAYGETKEETRANAQLMSASPLMLRTLKDMENRMRDIGELIQQGKVPDHIAGFCEASADRIHAVISRATQAQQATL